MRTFAIIPAAGVSQRMGTRKTLLPWGDSTVIEKLIEQWRRSQVERIVLVTRPENVAGTSLADERNADRVHVLTPDPPPSEMKASVLVGIEFVQTIWQPKSADAWLLAPADLANLTTEIIDDVITTYAEADRQFEMAIPRFEDKRGHPVLFSWRLAQEVTRLSASQNLKSLAELRVPRLEVPLPGRAPRDLDTWDEYLDMRPETTPPVERPGK